MQGRVFYVYGDGQSQAGVAIRFLKGNLFAQRTKEIKNNGKSE
jgi:hypothetical protein